MHRKVSVILTSYNKPKTVGDAIKSVLNQTYSNWELFIMDDHSNSETINVIKKYLNDERIHYLNSNIQDSKRYETVRYATLINDAIPKTTGAYLTYLTDDNTYLPDRFKKMTDIFRQNPQIEIVYSQQLVKWFDQNGIIQNEMIRRTKGILTETSELVDHCSVMHTRSIADQVYKDYGNYWDDNPLYWYNGDAVFWHRLSKISAFYPLLETLDIAMKNPDCYQRLSSYLPQTIPDGTLIKGPSTDTFLIEEQKRRKISPECFYKLKYDFNKLVNIPDPFVYRFTEGNVIDDQVFTNLFSMPGQRLIKPEGNSKIFYIQYQVKHHVNDQAFNNYKFDRNQIVIVKNDFLAKLPEGMPIKGLYDQTSVLPDGRLFLINSIHYLSLKNRLHPIDNLVAVKLNLPLKNPIIAGDSLLAKFKQGEPFTWVKSPINRKD